MASPDVARAVEATIAFVNDRFRDFYAAHEPWHPPRFGRREWGFMFLGKRFMARHIAFRSRDELALMLAREAPSHAYYSTAYYDRPAAPTMNEKGWRGADLIFDLDADHLPGAKEKRFEDQLAAVKDEAKWLLEEFVLGDFGFSESDVRVVFSGGRGYHIHVTHPDVQPLGSPERREIVDYVTANGLNVERFIHERAYEVDPFRKHAKKVPVMPGPEAPGWGGRLSRAVAKRAAALRSMPEPEALSELVSVPGIGAKKANDTLRAIRSAQAVDAGNLLSLLPKPLFSHWKQAAAVETAGEADEPVTSDVKRLIRLPGSLHGKTGLRVTIVEPGALDDFDPLRDAVPWDDEPVRVRVSKPETVTIRGERYDAQPGERELPLAVALFVMLRRKGTVA